MSAEDVMGIMTRPDWWADAACLGAGPEYFFWEEFSYEMIKDHYYMTEKAFKRARKRDLEKIKREMEEEYIHKYCDNCPVREECGEAGKFEAYGIWGGETFPTRFGNMTESEQELFISSRGGKRD